MSSIDVPLKSGRFTTAKFGQTQRKDKWWVEPLLVFLGYALFIVYANYAIINYNCGDHPCYEVQGTGYLSPMFSPLLTRESPAWWPSFAPFFGTMLILWAPLGFRFTCYYYRGAYYKAWWADPISCAVGEPRKSYWGERKWPLLIQNAHRYFLYFAILFIFILAYDAWKGLWFDGPNGPGTQFGIGVGSLVLILNPILLGMYTFGCHSFRHLVGGRKDVLSTSPMRKSCYDCVSGLNRKHMLWAWISMFYVGFVDLYIRLCAMHIWTDWRIL